MNLTRERSSSFPSPGSFWTMWSKDDRGAIILLKIPDKVCYLLSIREVIANSRRMKVSLDTSDKTLSPSSSVKFTTLCTEVQLIVVDHLRLVDRVCLGLTCKSMAKLVLLATALTPTEWMPFVDNPYSHLSSYDLRPRLAHGWIPKDRFRFCAWCCKIYTRSPDFWESRGMLETPLRWSSRLSVGKHVWMMMSKKAKYRYLILRWRDAKSEDGSGLKCVPCSIPSNEKLWYEMIHCPECTANTLALTPPGSPWKHRMARMETACMRALEAVSSHAIGTLEAVGGAVSRLVRYVMTPLQVRIRIGPYILPKWRSS